MVLNIDFTRFSLTRSQAFLTLFSSSGSGLLLTGGEVGVVDGPAAAADAAAAAGNPWAAAATADT